MLTEVKNQFKVSFLSIKYSVMRELLNTATFISNIVFMMLNNASMIIQWLVLYSLREDMGGYSFKEILLLWAMASATFGFSRFFFERAFHAASYGEECTRPYALHRGKKYLRRKRTSLQSMHGKKRVQRKLLKERLS